MTDDKMKRAAMWKAWMEKPVLYYKPGQLLHFYAMGGYKVITPYCFLCLDMIYNHTESYEGREAAVHADCFNRFEPTRVQ